MTKFRKPIAIAVIAGGLTMGNSANASERLTREICVSKPIRAEKVACFHKLLEQDKKDAAMAKASADKAEAEARQLDIEIEALRKVRALQKNTQKQ